MRSSHFVATSAIILCGAWIVNLLILAAEEGRALKFIAPIKDHALKGHVIKNLTIKWRDGCEFYCYFENDCVSYNLGPLSDDKFICELSDADRRKHAEDFELRQGFIYRETENACSRDPCSSHGKCQNGFTDKNYRCVCDKGYEGETCEKENWKKINTDPVCFGAKDDKYGSFRIRTTGSMIALKLVHKTGGLYCVQGYPETFWGCTHESFGNKKFLTLITHANKSILLPAKYELSVSTCIIKYSYGLDGVDVNAKELLFPPFSSPVHVSRDQEFQIWYGQDLADCSEINNSGEACVDVYIWYN